MNKVKLLLVTAFVLITTGIDAQNTFFPAKTGTVLVHRQKNDKGKVEHYSRQTVTAVEGSGSNMTISYLLETMDKDRKTLVETPCKLIIKNGVMIPDMKQLYAGWQKDPKVKLEVKSIPMELPNNMQPGQSLKDAKLTMNMERGVLKVKIDMDIVEGKCLAIENVTVPAGTFKCHKITQTFVTTAMKKVYRMQVVSWYAPNVGLVKTEAFNEKNVLQSTTELEEMK
jgi:hypothetical protein